MGLRDRLGRALGVARTTSVAQAEEKSWLTGSSGYELPVSGGFIPGNWPWNFWQQGRDVVQGGPNAIVHACTDAYAQTLASLRAQHINTVEGEGHAEITTSALSRFFREPNSYQTRSDFILNQVKGLLLTGNSYAVGFRNERNEIASLHLTDPRTTRPYIEPDTHEVFYALGDNPMLDENTIQMLVPARDVMHLRLYTPRHPLIGETPIRNLALSIASTNAITSHQAAFFSRMARPSGFLKTNEKLTKDQMTQLREIWEAQSTQLNAGGVPILASGIEWQAMSIDSQDSQLVEAFRMGVEDIARAFRVPLPLIGDTRNSNYNSIEQLISMWLAMGLGFTVEHLEQAYSKFFRVPVGTAAHFDTDTLMRTDFEGRIEALSKGVTSGIYSPNEARRKEGLKDVEFGAEPRVQQQVVPLSQVGRMPDPAPAPPAPPPAPGNGADDEEETLPAEEERGLFKDWMDKAMNPPELLEAPK